MFGQISWNEEAAKGTYYDILMCLTKLLKGKKKATFEW